MDRLGRRDASLLALLLAPWAWLTWRYAFVCDDAFITWRYSRNLALGNGPRYNLGDGLPVEGYSDFLWMLIGAMVEAVGLPPWQVIPWISAATGAALIVGVYALLRREGVAELPAFAAGLSMSTAPAFAVWSTSGLETMPQAFLMFAAFALLASGNDRRSAILAGCVALDLALIRTEGIAWALVIAVIGTGVRAARGNEWRRSLATYLGVLILPFAAYFAWRASYYQSWVANTAKAKVHLEPVTLQRGLMYVALYVATTLAPLALLPAIPAALLGRQRALAAGAALLAIAVPAYAVVVSGDYMTWFRILVPGLPFAAVVLGLAGQHLLDQGMRPALLGTLTIVLTAVGLLPGFDVHLVPERTREALSIREKLGFFRTENQQWEAMNQHVVAWKEKGEALKRYAEPGDRYVAAAIGATGYFSDLYIYDRNGLVNREVAELPWSGELRSPGHDKVVDRSFFFDKKPEILDSKVIGGFRIKAQLKLALRELEAHEVRDTYFPVLFPLPAEGRGERAAAKARYLVALRRADNKAAAVDGWLRFEADATGLRGPNGKVEPEATEAEIDALATENPDGL